MVIDNSKNRKYSCEHCEYSSDYKVAVVSHGRKHKKEPVPEPPVVEAKVPEKSVDKDGVEWYGAGEETDTDVGRSPNAGRFT